MKRLPKGLKKISKEEFVQKTMAMKEEKELQFSFNQRIGVEWEKIDEKVQQNKSIRW